jgi:hypothetical protein
MLWNCDSDFAEPMGRLLQPEADKNAIDAA